MNLFDIIAGKVSIHPDLLAIPCFKQLWDADKSRDKANANRYIQYIILKNYHSSPYVLSMSAEDIEPRLKKELFGDKDYKLPVTVISCEQDYRGFLYTRTLRMLDNMRNKIDSISNYYQQSLDEDLDEKKIKDLLAGMTSVGGVLKSIDSLETMVKAEELAIGKVKGDAKVNPYELAK